MDFVFVNPRYRIVTAPIETSNTCHLKVNVAQLFEQLRDSQSTSFKCLHELQPDSVSHSMIRIESDSRFKFLHPELRFRITIEQLH